MNKFQVLILAAGLGKRMKNPDLPKALASIKGKPLISFILDSIKKSDICEKPAIVISSKAELVKQALGPDYIYIHQAEQLGTGHAVMVAKDKLENMAENIVVLFSDQPLVSSETIKKITDAHLEKRTVITMGTVKVSDFEDWKAGYYDFGRIIRDEQGSLKGIVEKKDATPEQLEIKELNPSYFCFKADWLWQNLDQLKSDNSQGEYYLTDLIDIAFNQGEQITTVDIEPKEALGVNTVEHLELIENLLT